MRIKGEAHSVCTGGEILSTVALEYENLDSRITTNLYSEHAKLATVYWFARFAQSNSSLLMAKYSGTHGYYLSVH